MKNRFFLFPTFQLLGLLSLAVMSLSGCVLMDLLFPQTVETPQFSIAEGKYTSDLSVAITCATEGVTIHYTIDGTTPSASSAAYSAAISVAGYGTSMTMKAIAVNPGMLDSDVASATYTISSIYLAGIYVWNENSSTVMKCGYWKNDVFVDLPGITSSPETNAIRVDVSGSDVYVSGFTRNISSVPVPCYWKNGARTDLSMLDSTKQGAAFGIFVSGSDVYASGFSSNSSDYAVPCYWKNGARTDLPVPAAWGGLTTAVVLSGSDVYMSGFTLNGGTSVVPCYWKNATRTDFSALDSAGSGYAVEIAISGSDVYCSGSWAENRTSSDQTPCYWKNGIRTDLSQGRATGSFSLSSIWMMFAGIAVSQSDVYVAGMTGDSPPMPCYWKNGTRTVLTIPTGNSGKACDLAVSGSDVFVSGLIVGNSTPIACYWKNGILANPPLPTGAYGGVAMGILLY